MKTFHEGRIARTARFIAFRLESESEVRLSIPSEYADSRIFRIMTYMTRYCGKYWIEYPGDNTAIIRKQG
jgi:hypothetical protein